MLFRVFSLRSFPIFCSFSFSFALIRFDIVGTSRANRINALSDWLAAFLRAPPLSLVMSRDWLISSSISFYTPVLDVRLVGSVFESATSPVGDEPRLKEER